MDARHHDTGAMPETRDLGRFDEAVLVCGGAYSNLEALIALFDAAQMLGIPANRIIHTGDVVAYCADPAETAGLLRGSQAYAIPGNVEESLSQQRDDCQCGFGEGTLCDALSAEWFGYANTRVGAELRTWMGGLPSHLAFTMGDARVRVVHGAPGAVNRFVFASQPDADFEAEFTEADADMIVAGHSGIPFTRRVGARVWHNSGALGLPANDGTPRGWYSVLTPEDGGIRIAHHALHYDHASAREKMLRAGLSAEYAETLASGLWPGLDVLPEDERKATGTPLHFSEPFVWENGEPVV